MKRNMLSQLLLPAARERLSRIQLVRPQRADQITALLARMAQSGQLRGRVSEEQLVDVLNQVEAMESGRPGAQGGKAESKIVVRIRRTACCSSFEWTLSSLFDLAFRLLPSLTCTVLTAER